MSATLLALAAFLGAWWGGELIRRHALRVNLLDVPNHRSSHSTPTPRGAGLALAISVVAALAPRALAAGDWTLAAILAGQVVIAALGFADDIRSLPSLWRLAVQIAAAVWLVAGAGPWLPFQSPWPMTEGIVVFTLALVWTVGLTNSYNFMDGIDGISGAQAVVAGAGWALLGWMTGEATIALLGLLVAAASLGFLLLNWPPARIFMGDVGSGFLGFTFAALALLAARHSLTLAVCGFLLVWPFVIDAAYTFLRRLRRGENVLEAHRSHAYQRLVVAGRTHRQVTVLYAALAGVGLLASVACVSGRLWGLMFAVAVVLLAVVVVGRTLRRLEGASAKSALGR